MMGIPLRIIEAPAEGTGYVHVQPGDMWPDGDEWTIMLPNRTVWSTWEHASGTGRRWDVTGEAPDLTVHPSIDDRDPANPWHGWIRGGFLEPA